MRVISLLPLIVVYVAFLSCQTDKNKSATENTPAVVAGDTINIPADTKSLNGKELAQAYCQSCHAFPEPHLLEREIWKNAVLPEMGIRLGLKFDNYKPLAKMLFRELEILHKENILPQKPLISKDNWDKIVEYYVSNAPDSIPTDHKRDASKGLNGFGQLIPEFNLNNPFSVSFLKFDSLHSNFFVADTRGYVNILNNRGVFTDSFSMKSPVVDIRVINQKEFDVMAVGNINPSDLPQGGLFRVLNEKGIGSVKRGLIGSLRRPLSFSFGDFNDDGMQDYLINQFGSYTGGLYWYENKGNDVFEEHTLRNKPGSVKSIIKDLNGDNRKDIISLMAQGDEGIFVYYNQGKGNFTEKNLLRFPPVNGSNYFDLIDFNKDGFDDILYVNGDNADYSYSLKNYHGVSIYINDGKNNFKREWFYPLYGASKAIAKDYDRDGDLDVAAIAFFADFEHSNPVPFVYLENKGNYNFDASTLEDPTVGRWLTMDSGDFDKDGDEDIVLGKYLTSPTPVPQALFDKWKKSSPYILILDNKFEK